MIDELDRMLAKQDAERGDMRGLARVLMADHPNDENVRLAAEGLLKAHKVTRTEKEEQARSLALAMAVALEMIERWASQDGRQGISYGRKKELLGIFETLSGKKLRTILKAQSDHREEARQFADAFWRYWRARMGRDPDLDDILGGMDKIQAEIRSLVAKGAITVVVAASDSC
jgi:hypothetical protein